MAMIEEDRYCRRTALEPEARSLGVVAADIAMATDRKRPKDTTSDIMKVLSGVLKV